MRLSLLDVIGATGGAGEGAGTASFGSYHTDSRDVLPGGLFFALRGAQMDGHKFVDDAIRRGAAGVLVERALPTPAGVARIRVEDSWRALYDLARMVHNRVRPLTIGVTGSNGKTSTKEFLAAAMELHGPVLKTIGNLNTETGVPLTMLRLDPEHRSLVLEMGLQLPGDVARLATLARPAIGVITNIGTVHLEHFASQEELARGKGELVTALPAQGIAVLPAHSPYFELLKGLTQATVVTFGPGSSYAPEHYQVSDEGARFTVRGVEVRLSLTGRHMAENACAALAAAEAAGVHLEQAAPRLHAVRVGQRLEERATPEGYTVVDDAYNASPESMLAAFEAVAERPHSGRLLAVLGEMRELGPAAEAAHQDVGRAAKLVFDALCVVDVGLGRRLAEAAGAQVVAGPEEAVRWVKEHARPGDLILVKASHGVHLEHVVTDLLGPG